MADLVYLPATEALALFRSGELAPVELMAAVVERAQQTEHTVNAFTDRYFEDALDQAREAGDRYARGEARPLEGLPVAIKEEQPIAGLPWREGSTLLRDNIATETHPIVERIMAAGGIVHARTTTPEFCCAGFTHSDLWGITRTPWNPDYSSGGSSGGSGAALAAGSAMLATGSDIGGSIRIPASFNGVVGFKPPYGRVPSMPPVNLDTYCHDGPLARTVPDCALLQNVIAGPHPMDPASLPAQPPITIGGITGLKVALCMNLGDYPVEPEVVSATQTAADILRDAGVKVEEIELPWTREEIMAAAWAHYGAIFAPMIETAAAGREVLRYTRDFVERANAAGTFFDAMMIEGKIQEDLAKVFTRADALICPASGVPALLAGEDYVDTPLVVNGVELAHHLEAPLTVPFNVASRCPVLSVPSGLAQNRVPIGLQVVGRPYDDATVFALGNVVTAANPWYVSRYLRPQGIA
ncbi:aspartyl-tRNA(Asn)/glutamyl-tRNA(Gln) amidotransferase subunit A [Kibdelosporangium banguiense]|uniref:Aspartyl-tRNA(Asn)/glutamyl-tRNA(Gln) amidotransferase subunit A n=1 Tax=Kibdelosporangium banguiense TaxID=1365924 RepID=A0ABS4TGM9_9PSEU|nr:amidase [Kibdelosporangium banguiense]MBP2323580.1 aspartyl-tRNA(Asn)/glutamyl-tRNA(Gln) amidotransferase subunit A [Kibdelosporangium banguiense]